ncbi:polysaccharide biosynthesis tyrosine autokinase [Phenylobacterium sp.]|jgi:capsular exopolysaccharide synthesis family protein|uniref:polysaccharide biosynthesis tyrosine autokinase n=1 Tax=Phenylobacterium sp. TaxID=1871053 RepID=UPI002F93F899
MNIYNPAPSPEPEASFTSPRSLPFGQLDLRRLYAAFRRRLRLFGAVLLAVLLACVLLTQTATPMYTATANVMLDTRQERVTNVEEVLSGLPADSSVVDTEVEVLRSRQLAERVVRSLELDTDPEFNSAIRKPSGLGAVIATLKGATGLDEGPARLSPIEAQKQHERIVDVVLGHLSVKRAGLTYVINVSFESEQPAKAARIANKFAELYLLEQMEAKFEATRQATRWLNTRLDELRGQVLADEAAVQQFKIANNLLSASGTNLTEQEISNYNQTLAQARAQVAEDQARLNTARQQLARGSTGEDVGEALSSPVIQNLRNKRTEVSARVADLQGRYGERHPEMLKAKRELQDIDGQIQAEIQRIISNLEAKAQVSRERAGAIGGSLGGARGTLEANNRAMVRLNELQRTAEASRTLYESYLNRFKETSTQQGIEQSDARVVSKAKIPTGQSSPKVALNLALGLLLALGAGVGAVVLAEMLDSGLATAEDVERRLETAYLGAVPLLASVAEDSKSAPIDYVVEKPLSSFSEAFRNLRTSILYARLGDAVKVVAVTSSLPGEGKTTTSICLGRTSALQGARTIVVDCDLRRRTVNRVLGADPKVGLLEVLAGEATLQDAIETDKATGAHFLPLAKSAFTPKDVFGSQAMDRLLAELRNRYDLVVLDTAPVLPVADTRVLAPKADAVVFLARWRKTPQQAIESAFRLLTGTGAHLGGVALTQMDMKEQARYGYGDPGYYYAEYKKYYVS